MGPSSEVEFFDYDPIVDEFFDYNPEDLQKLEVASEFSDTNPDGLTNMQDEVTSARQKFKQKYIYAPEKTPEEIRAMSIREKMEYAKDLEREREYLQSQGFVKGSASGASFGFSQYVPGFAPEEDDLLFGFGELIGSALPISRIYNWLGAPLVKMAAKSPYAASALQSLARMGGFGATGATYEGTKEAVLTGEPPSVSSLLKHGAMYGALDGALQLVGKGVQYATKIGQLAKSKGVSGQEIINENIEQLAAEKINPELEPEKFAERAEELLDQQIANAEKQAKIETENKEIVKSKTETIKAKSKPLEISRTAEESIPEPITETTGEGAAERIEYNKSASTKVVEAVNDFIKAAKTPVETFKKTTEAINTGAFNFLAPLEKLESQIPVPNRVSTRIKLAQTAASEVNSVLENGIFSNMTGQFEHQGLKGAYGDLTWKAVTRDLKPTEYSIPELNEYRTSKIALKRQSQGKKTGVDTAIAEADVKRLKEKYEPIDRRIRQFQKATINEYGKDLLGSKLTRKFNESYYSPLYRVMDSGADAMLQSGSLTPKQPFKIFKGSERKIIPPSESDPYNAAMLIQNKRKNDSVLAYMDLVQQGKMPGKIRAGKQKPIPEGIKKDLELDFDPEMEDVAENLYNQSRRDGFIPEKNTLRGWKNGKAIDIEVPEDIYNVFKGTVNEPLSGFPKIFSAVNRLFSKGISYEPRKFASILGRDMLSSLIYSKTGANPISIFEAMGDIFGNKELYKQFKALGGDTYASRLATRAERTAKINELVTPGKEGPIVAFDKMISYFKKYPKLLNDMSMAVPYAEYKRALQVFGDTAEGRIAAAMEAKKVTYDPNRKGASKMIRGIGNFTPFWNVSLQDLSMLGKNLKDKETWIKGITAISAPTLALKFWNDGNPDYDELTPGDKAAFWHIYSGDTHVRIPIPWLLGTTFKVGTEMFYDMTKSAASQDDQLAKEAWKSMYESFVSNLSGSLNPIVQMYIEQSTGKSPASPLGVLLGVSSSKAPEVVPQRLKDLPPPLQYTAKTSQISRWFGEKWNMSPIKIDKLIKGFGGLVAADVLALTDEAAYWSGLETDKRPEQNEKNYLLLGNFFADSTATYTKYQQDFYEILSEQTQQKKAQKLVPEYGNPDLLLVDLSKYNKSISAGFKRIRELEDSDDLTASEKKEQIKEQRKEINRLYKESVTQFRISQQNVKK